MHELGASEMTAHALLLTGGTRRRKDHSIVEQGLPPAPYRAYARNFVDVVVSTDEISLQMGHEAWRRCRFRDPDLAQAWQDVQERSRQPAMDVALEFCQ